MRKSNPLLADDLRKFWKKVQKGSLLGNMLIKRYYKSTRWIKNPGREQARNKRVFGLVKDFGTSQSPKSTRPLTTYLCPSRPGHQALRNNFASSLLLRT